MDNHELRQLSGIYRLDFSSGHFYIGQSANVLTRWRLHRSKFNNGEMKRKHPKMFNIWAKYGEPTCRALVYCEIDEMTRIEQHLIDTYWDDPLLANTNPDAKTSRGVKRTHVPWQQGKKFTAEHRQRLSDAKRGRLGVDVPNHQLTEDDIRQIRQLYVKDSKTGWSSVKLGQRFGVSGRTIRYIVNGERYANITE